MDKMKQSLSRFDNRHALRRTWQKTNYYESSRLGSMKCRFLYLIGQLGPGGAERQLLSLLKSMDRDRYRPEVVVWNFREDDMHVPMLRTLNICLHSFRNLQSRISKLRGVRRLVRKLNPEVVHSYSFYTNFAAWWATRGSNTIPIGSIRQDFVTERRLSGMVAGRLSARLPMIQISNSLAAQKAVEQFGGLFKPGDVHVIQNGINIDGTRVHPLPQNRCSLLAIGRLYPEKRWDRLLKAIALLAARKITFTVRLAGDGPLLNELRSQATHLGVDRLVEFLGVRHDVPVLLNESSFLVHTADAEGCPNVVMEAMACGRAVIATDAGDVPHLVEDGRTGFVVRRGDDLKLVDCMARLITDRDLARRMGEAGRVKAEREFGLDRLVSETLAAYQAAGWKDA
jgi:glycosyltransferase involved in cell wall biosynthesis